MTIKHNQQIQHNHFRKDWQRRVRVHFDQAGKKASRRNARLEKAAKVAPRPVDRLRPVVRCPTVKYNRRVRAGRGFTFAELKEAGIPRKLAPTVGIAVDPRRQNFSEESLKANVARLKEYKERLVVFPRANGKPKAGDAPADEVSAAKQIGEYPHDGKIKHSAKAFPISNKYVVKDGKVSDFKPTENAYRTLREARSEARYKGAREKRSKDKAEEEANAKK